MIIELLIIFFILNIGFHVFLNIQEGFGKKLKKKLKKAAKKAGKGISNTAQAVGSGISNAAQAVASAVTTAATTGINSLDQENQRRWERLRELDRETKDFKKKALELEKDIKKLEKRYDASKTITDNDGKTESEISTEMDRLREKYPPLTPLTYNC
tara:strand:- start:2390 stop:2857 length:468 start_codon:yes stop_codon:yes gene_type:complete